METRRWRDTEKKNGRDNERGRERERKGEGRRERERKERGMSLCMSLRVILERA